MQKDITEKELVQCNDVFADIYNEGIFGGKKILREEELRPMTADYSFHLVEMGSLPEEVRKRFQSDFRVLAEYAATRREPEKWEAFLREYPKKLDHPEELFDALKAVAGDERYEQIAEQLTKEEKEEGVRMCVVAEKLERIGIEKGRMEERANTERLEKRVEKEKSRAEREKSRAEKEKKRAEEEKHRAEEEKHRADVAEARVIMLERELERLKGMS